MTVTATLPETLKKHIDDTRVFATVAALGPNGHPHLTVVWLARDGDDLLFSTTVDRQQGKNIAADSRVTVLINPPDQPYLFAEIRGIASLTPDPERAMPDQLSLKYTGKPYAEFNPASVSDGDRVIVRVTPRKVVSRI